MATRHGSCSEVAAHGSLPACLCDYHAGAIHADYPHAGEPDLRGVAFEFRWRTHHESHLWDFGFWIGSSLAAIMQGISLGALVQGIAVEGRQYAGGWWDWLTPFSILTGIAVLVGYALLGATWLNLKTTGDIQIRSAKLARPLSLVLLALIGPVSLWTPFINEIYFERWFGWPTASSRLSYRCSWLPVPLRSGTASITAGICSHFSRRLAYSS